MAVKTAYILWLLGIYATSLTFFILLRTKSQNIRTEDPTIPLPYSGDSFQTPTSKPKKGPKDYGLVEKKCISYAVFQLSEQPPSPAYTDGFLFNADLARLLFPGWKIFLYLDSRLEGSDFHKTITGQHSDIVNIVWKESSPGRFGMTWRFLVADHEDCDRWIVRDADDRLSIRHLQAVLDWIWSGYSFHIMRDHPEHDVPILGGLWGGVKGCFGDGVKIEDILEDYFNSHKALKQQGNYGIDQTFLIQAVFPRIRGLGSYIAHDDFGNQHGVCRKYGDCKKFPAKDMPYKHKYVAKETLNCTCKPMCVCNNATCPIKSLANGNSSPLCM